MCQGTSEAEQLIFDTENSFKEKNDRSVRAVVLPTAFPSYRDPHSPLQTGRTSKPFSQLVLTSPMRLGEQVLSKLGSGRGSNGLGVGQPRGGGWAWQLS